MLNSRNIHFAVLGIILGAAVAYVYASYQTETSRHLEAEAAAATTVGSMPAGHPDVSEEQVLGMFEEALAANPNDPELLVRYGDYLFSEMGRYDEAARVLSRALEITPEDAEVRTFLATALYASGRRSEAVEEFERALETDPDHLLALHNLTLAHIDFTGDLDAAEALVERIEAVDANYAGLTDLRARIAGARARSGLP